MNSFKAGYIIKVSDSLHPETSGVIIDGNQSQVTCFNCDVDRKPIFYQVNLAKANYRFDNNKTINHSDYQHLKKAILQYYHVHKDNQQEVKMLQRVLDFAFPNGIPKVQNKSIHVDEYQPEDSQLLEVGTQIKLKCNPFSSVCFLDNQVVDVTDFTPKGVRVVRRGATSDSNKRYTLFYRQPPHDNSFAGVQEIEILPKRPHKPLTIQEQLKVKAEKEKDAELGFLTQIMDTKKNIYDVDSTSLQIKQNNNIIGTYHPGSDEINITPVAVEYESGPVQNILINDDSDGEDDFPVAASKIITDNNTPMILSDGSSSGSDGDSDEEDNQIPINSILKNYHVEGLEEVNLDNTNMKCSQSGGGDVFGLDSFDIDDNNKEIIDGMSGGGKEKPSRSVKRSREAEGDEFEGYDDSLTDEIEGLKSKLVKNDDDLEEEMFDDNKSVSDAGSGSGTENSEFDMNEFEIDDEPIDIEVSKVVYKSQKVAVPDERKVYQPQIQKNEFFKYLVEKYIPNKQLRRNNFLVNQVHKINNRIVDLKDEFIKLNATEPKTQLEETYDVEQERLNPFEGDRDLEKENIEDVRVYNKGKKPLLEAYLKNDYRNKFLIPIVLDRKKLYFPNEVSDYHYEFYTSNSNILNKNQQQVINDIMGMIEQKASSKISSITYFQLEKGINETMKPYKINDDSKMIGFIGNNADKISDDDLPFDDFTGFVIRYNQGAFKSQGIDFQESDIEGYNIKSPLIYFVEKFKEKYGDVDADDDILMVEDVENQWVFEEYMETSIKNQPKFKKMQEGDRFNIVGFLALPLKHAFNQHQIYYDSISGLYENYKNTTGIEEMVVEKDTEIENPLSLRDKPVFFYCPETDSQRMDKEEYLNKLIPDFKEICEAHKAELKVSSNWSDLEKVIESYGYNLRYLNIEDWKLLSKILDSNLEGKTYVLSKRWLNYQKFLQHETPTLASTAKYFALIDKMVLEGLENYYEKYPALNKTIDSDANRLAWILQQPDNGRLLELMLSKNQLIEDERSVNRNELDQLLAKKKQELEILEGRYKRDLDLSKMNKKISECQTRPKYQIVKTYQTVHDLDKDNNIDVKNDMGTGMVKVDQHAVVKQNNKVYVRRELPNKKQVWEETALKADQLHELIKNQCETPAFDNLKALMNDDECQYQKDDMQCHPGHLDRIYREIKNHRKYVAVLESELEDIKNIEFKKRNIDKELAKTKGFLSSHRNLEKLKREFTLEGYRKIIEDVKKAQQKVKDCPHYQVINYFMKMKHITPVEKYSLMNTILQKFQDLAPVFLKDLAMGDESSKELEDNIKEYGRIDIVNPNLNFNWTYCSICHQKLICNHVLYANKLIKESENDTLDEKILKDMYGIEVDQNYNCKVCGEFLVSSDEIDMDGFVRKADANDQKIITREIIDQEAERRQIRKNILDELLDDVESKMDEDSKDMKLFLDTIQMLKSFTKVKLLSYDEEDIISFIKSEPFLTREYFKKMTAAQIHNQQLLEYQAAQFFYRFAIYDITARFLITLQTSEMSYIISNDLAKGNLSGFPLGKENDLSTVQYFVSLLQKMASLPEFSFLSKEQNIEARFMARLKVIIQNQNVQQKYKEALERKTLENISDDPFAKNTTNFWLGYRPCLGVLDAGWSPSVGLNPDKINKIVVSKYGQFMSDLRENLSSLSAKIFDINNKIISKEYPAVAFHKEVKLGNSCCLTQVKEGFNTSYYDYIINKDPGIKELINTLASLDVLNTKIEKKIWHVAEPPAFMKVEFDSKVSMDPYLILNQEYVVSDQLKNKLFMLYVDNGINRGSVRIFNSFDICTLSGETKKEIIDKEYNDGDYKDLLSDIRKKNKITVSKPKGLKQDKILTETITNFIENNKGLDKSGFLQGFLTRLKEIIVGEESEDKKEKELEKHWGKLNQQITQEIDTLVNNMSVIKKDPELKTKLFKLGDYNKVYQEDDMGILTNNEVSKSMNDESKDIMKSMGSKGVFDDDYGSKEFVDKVNGNLFKEASNKRAMRIEKNLKNYLFNFFRNSLSIIKNNAFDKYNDFDMNNQWKYLIYYREYQSLFSKLFDLFNSLTNDLELFIGNNSMYFNYQNSASFFRCMLFIVLNQMIDYKAESKKGKVHQFIPKVDHEDDSELAGEISRTNVDKFEEDIRNFNLKVFSDRKIIILYITQIMDKIFKEEEDFNQLTQSYLTIVYNKKIEERNRKTLSIFAKLAVDDTRKDLRRAILDQKRLGLIDYDDFEDIIEREINAGEDKVPFDRDMELLDDLNEMGEVPGDLIEEKRRQKMLDYEVEDDEYDYVPGEDDDIEDF
jgi:hypothetical protein